MNALSTDRYMKSDLLFSSEQIVLFVAFIMNILGCLYGFSLACKLKNNIKGVLRLLV